MNPQIFREYDIRGLVDKDLTVDVVEKLEIAPDGRVYLSCAEVAGPGRALRFDFNQAILTTVEDR